MSWQETPALFQPLAQQTKLAVSVAVRTAGNQAATGPEIQRETAAIDSDIAVADTDTMDHVLSKSLEYPRFRAVLFGVFAICALLLAVVGISGVLGQFVAQRTQEFGVRKALGARAADLFLLVARQSGLPIVAGLTAGVSAAIALARFLASLLYGVRSADPLSLALVALALLAAAGVAVALPAGRATRVDPLAALRND